MLLGKEDKAKFLEQNNEIAPSIKNNLNTINDSVLSNCHYDPIFFNPQSNHLFHIGFNKLKNSFNIKDSRKTHIDSLLKKVKSKSLKSIHEVFKLYINLIVGRLPQKFITNIKIDYNKHYLNIPIGDIYFEFNLVPSLNDILSKKLVRKGRENDLKEIWNMKLNDVIKCYLKSDLYRLDYEKIKEKDGNESAILYNYVAQNMSNYYFYSKGNKKRVELTNSDILSNKKTIFNINHINM